MSDDLVKRLRDYREFSEGSAGAFFIQQEFDRWI
jgi:hypothetical protein